VASLGVIKNFHSELFTPAAANAVAANAAVAAGSAYLKGRPVAAPDDLATAVEGSIEHQRLMAEAEARAAAYLALQAANAVDPSMYPSLAGESGLFDRPHNSGGGSDRAPETDADKRKLMNYMIRFESKHLDLLEGQLKSNEDAREQRDRQAQQGQTPTQRSPPAAVAARAGAGAMRVLSDGLGAVSDMVGQFMTKRQAAPAGAPAGPGVALGELNVLTQRNR